MASLFFDTPASTPTVQCPNQGTAWVITSTQIPATNITGAVIELFDESMRLPHWHPNADEMGYLNKGTIQVNIWKSFGEKSQFVVKKGGLWFIPIGAMHSLDNIGDETAELVFGFSAAVLQSVDLPVAFNGIPCPVRSAYTNPHSALINYVGPTVNPTFGAYTPEDICDNTSSPYGANFRDINPLFEDCEVGNVTWAVADNWPILQGSNISTIRNILCPGVTRDAIWYPDASILYIVTKGSGVFTITFNRTTITQKVDRLWMIFVPQGAQQTFYNSCSSTEKFELVGFFSKSDPDQEVSLAVSTFFLPPGVQEQALTQFCGSTQPPSEPLAKLKDFKKLPFLLQYSGCDCPTPCSSPCKAHKKHK